MSQSRKVRFPAHEFTPVTAPHRELASDAEFRRRLRVSCCDIRCVDPPLPRLLKWAERTGMDLSALKNLTTFKDRRGAAECAGRTEDGKPAKGGVNFLRIAISKGPDR